MNNNDVMMEVAASEMRGKRSELKGLMYDLFESGIIPNNARNKFLVQLLIYCVKAIIKLTKDGDVKLL